MRLQPVPKYSKRTTTLLLSATMHSSDFSEIRAQVLSHSCDIVFSRSCFFILACVVVIWSCVCTFSPYITISCNIDLLLDCNRLQVVENPCKQEYLWHKEGPWHSSLICAITWEGLIATLNPKPRDKNCCPRSLFYFLVIFLVSKFSLLTCDIALSVIHILEEQSSEENFSLFFSTQTWF
jgi:hypothetical protein